MNQTLLNHKVEVCNKCNVAPNRGFGYGNIKSRIMFIAQNPGWQPNSRSSDIIPFGLDEGGENSGKWLTKLLDEVKLKPNDYYITNVIKCPTPHNRPPKDTEIIKCLPFLRMELELQKPTLIFFLGKTAQSTYDFYKDELFKNLGYDPYIHLMWHPGLMLRSPGNFKQWRKEFLEFWDKHKDLVKQSMISHHQYRKVGAYAVGIGTWQGAVYSDIYKAEAFRDFLRGK